MSKEGPLRMREACFKLAIRVLSLLFDVTSSPKKKEKGNNYSEQPMIPHEFTFHAIQILSDSLQARTIDRQKMEAVDVEIVSILLNLFVFLSECGEYNLSGAQEKSVYERGKAVSVLEIILRRYHQVKNGCHDKNIERRGPENFENDAEQFASYVILSTLKNSEPLLSSSLGDLQKGKDELHKDHGDENEAFYLFLAGAFLDLHLRTLSSKLIDEKKSKSGEKIPRQLLLHLVELGCHIKLPTDDDKCLGNIQRNQHSVHVTKTFGPLAFAYILFMTKINTSCYNSQIDLNSKQYPEMFRLSVSLGDDQGEIDWKVASSIVRLILSGLIGSHTTKATDCSSSAHKANNQSSAANDEQELQTRCTAVNVLATLLEFCGIKWLLITTSKSDDKISSIQQQEMSLSSAAHTALKLSLGECRICLGRIVALLDDNDNNDNSEISKRNVESNECDSTLEENQSLAIIAETARHSLRVAIATLRGISTLVESSSEEDEDNDDHPLHHKMTKKAPCNPQSIIHCLQDSFDDVQDCTVQFLLHTFFDSYCREINQESYSQLDTSKLMFFLEDEALAACAFLGAHLSEVDVFELVRMREQAHYQEEEGVVIREGIGKNGKEQEQQIRRILCAVKNGVAVCHRRSVRRRFQRKKSSNGVEYPSSKHGRDFLSIHDSNADEEELLLLLPCIVRMLDQCDFDGGQHDAHVLSTILIGDDVVPFAISSMMEQLLEKFRQLADNINNIGNVNADFIFSSLTWCCYAVEGWSRVIIADSSSSYSPKVNGGDCGFTSKRSLSLHMRRRKALCQSVVKWMHSLSTFYDNIGGGKCYGMDISMAVTKTLSSCWLALKRDQFLKDVSKRLLEQMDEDLELLESEGDSLHSKLQNTSLC